MTDSRLAVVTGVSRGIGHAIAEMLLAEGWGVVGLSRTAPPPMEGLYWFEWDAKFGEPIEDIFVSNGIESIDALIHCAGSQEPVGPVETSDPDDWVDAIDVNLIGTYTVVRATLSSLKRSEDARILLFSGGGAFSARPNYSAYAVAKAGTVALMEALSGELPSNITINCVAPGFVPTGIHAPTLAAGIETVGVAEYRHATQTPNGEMERAVACVRHLLSNSARGLTGKTISAPYDDWQSIMPWTVDALNASKAGTRTRHGIARLNVVARHPTAVLV